MVRRTRIAAPLTLVVLALGCGSSKEDPNEAPPAASPSPVKVAPIDAAPPPPPTTDASAKAAPTAVPTDPAAADGDRPPPTNLKVLPKSWSRDRVDAYMKQQVSRGLGVKCRHCHDTDDFAKDTEHKKEARAMMLMVNDINRDFFGGKARVSCMTCHLGKKEPPGAG